MDKLLKHFQDTESPIDWLIDQMFKQGYFDGNKPLTFTNLDHLQQQAKQKEVELIQKTIDRTLLVYKELKRD